MRGSYTIFQYDQAHRLKGPPQTFEARSFVKAFLQIVFVEMSNVSTNVIDITNTSRTLSNEQLAYTTVANNGLNSKNNLLPNNGRSSGGGGNSVGQQPWDILADQCGIMVGTGSTAVAVADKSMETVIANGSGAGQFVYYGCYGLNYTTGASSASFDIEREWRNNSGGSVTVAEIGIYAATSMNGNAAAARAFCIMRDVLSPTVAVANGEYLKVKYTITVSN